MKKTLGRGLAASAQLALVAFLSVSLTATTHDSLASTLSSQKIKVFVAAPSQEEQAAYEKAARLDNAMKALSARDAALYRSIFVAQAAGDLVKARTLSGELTDTRLMGHVLADRLMRGEATASSLVKWLEAYASLPQAQALYDKARKMGVARPPQPQAPDAWQGGAEIDSAANFTPELTDSDPDAPSGNRILAKAVQKDLRKGDPWAARDRLLAAQAARKVQGTFAHDLEAVIASAFFAAGERDQSFALAGAAAGANQPLGLWIKGLISWENKDYVTARLMFARLAEHPALSDTNRAAANFWTYRAFARLGQKAESHPYLQAAASVPRSFYGLLAAQLMGKNPVAALAKDDAMPVWGKTYQAVLADTRAGWRAMALIQVGQNDLAEAELRLLSPMGDARLLEAMVVLANYVPMPALSVQLASLGKSGDYESALYPVPPWQPKEGFEVDRALLFALARHESMFDPTAVSRKGAQGLLQIMPATARGLVREAAIAADKDDTLLDPAYNMTLGQKYVQYLAGQRQIGDNLVLLLAAYNAGPAKAVNWMSGKDSTDPLLFLESLPSRETRGYVARVLPHYWAYRARLGRPTPSLRQMAEGQWPSVNLTESKPVHVAAR